MAYCGSKMLSVGRTVIRGICREKQWMECISPISGFAQEKEKSLCWCGAISYNYRSQSSDSLGPWKNINF